MRQDRRPYWVKKVYLAFRRWYANHFLAPKLDYLGEFFTIMQPWHVKISGPNISIGKCATIVAEPKYPVTISVWGRNDGEGCIEIGDYALITPGCRINASARITIGDSVMMAHGVYVTDSDWHGIYDRSSRPEQDTPVVIKDNVWLGDGATVLKGVTIGENSIVGARAVVVCDVPPNVVVAGNPARVVKQLDPTQGFRTRADYFADPAGLEAFFDTVDYQVLKDNGFFNWLRALCFPTRRD